MNNHKINYYFQLCFYSCLVAIFIIPFLILGAYYPPISSGFIFESSSIFFALLIGLFAILLSDRILISHTSIACIFFSIYLILQTIFVKIRFIGINFTVSIEFLIGAILSVGISSFINNKEMKQKELMVYICKALLIGTSIQVLIAYLQFTKVADGLSDLVLYIKDDGGHSNIFGNLGQKNDYVDFISIGFFALMYLYINNNLNKLLFWLWTFFYLINISIANSRTAFVYFILAITIISIYYFKNKGDDNKKIFYLILKIFIILLLCELIIPKVMSLVNPETGVTSGLYRFNVNDINQSTYRRFYEWYKCIVLFFKEPLFGVGWYQYPREAIYIMLTDPKFMYIPANSALYSHSHNSFLNILAESGILGFTIIIIYGVCYSIYSMFKSFNNKETLFLVIMISTILGQSFFQYPLWYARFLMIIILFISVNKSAIIITNKKSYKWIIAIFACIFVVFLINNAKHREELFQYSMVPNDFDEFKENVVRLRNNIDNNIFWSFPSLMVLDLYLRPTSLEINRIMSISDQAHYIDMLGNETPYASIIFKQLIIHKLANDGKSLYYADLLAHAFPKFKNDFIEKLSSIPGFENEVKVLNNFQYEDRSIFKKLISH